MTDKLQGIIIPAVTPFDENGEVDLDRLRHNYEKWNETKVRGYMCLGSNGEFRSLNDDEALAVIKAASTYRGKDKTLIAGVGRESLHATLEFIGRMKAEEIVVDYISVLTPCYFAKLMTDEALVNYYKKIADASPYPVLLYCAPPFANSVCISVEAAKQLADHPNIHGMKDTSKDMMEAYMESLAGREDFVILSGSLGNLMACLNMGGKGGVVSAANYFPDRCAKLIEIFENEGADSASRYMSELQKLVKETGGRASVAGIKCCMNLTGFQGGYPRLPILPVGKELELEIKQVIDSLE